MRLDRLLKPKSENILIISKRTLLYPILERSILGGWSRIKAIIGRVYRRSGVTCLDRLEPMLLNKALCWLSHSSPHASCQLLVDREDVRLEGEITGFVTKIMHYPQTYFRGIFRDRNFINQLRDEKYDGVILVYTDSIGLGWLNLDLFSLVALRPKELIIINSKGRVFLLTPWMLIRMLVLRLIDKFWIAQGLCLLLLILLLPVAWLYVLRQRALGKSRYDL